VPRAFPAGMKQRGSPPPPPWTGPSAPNPRSSHGRTPCGRLDRPLTGEAAYGRTLQGARWPGAEGNRSSSHPQVREGGHASGGPGRAVLPQPGRIREESGSIFRGTADINSVYFGHATHRRITAGGHLPLKNHFFFFFFFFFRPGERAEVADENARSKRPWSFFFAA